MEKVREKHRRWMLGVYIKTPGYIVKKEMKRKERFMANVERAMSWEDRMRKGEREKKIVY